MNIFLAHTEFSLSHHPLYETLKRIFHLWYGFYFNDFFALFCMWFMFSFYVYLLQMWNVYTSRVKRKLWKRFTLYLTLLLSLFISKQMHWNSFHFKWIFFHHFFYSPSASFYNFINAIFSYFVQCCTYADEHCAYWMNIIKRLKNAKRFHFTQQLTSMGKWMQMKVKIIDCEYFKVSKSKHFNHTMNSCNPL